MTERTRYLSEEGPIRVLHVDDDACFLKTAKEILEMQGIFQVEPASSVQEAIGKMKTEKYDVVVCDYQMPQEDGLQFLRELRKKGNTTPFIMFTGKGREEVAVHALNLGADGYINKQGSPETVYGELAYSVKSAVARRKVAEALRSSEEKYRAYVENSPVAFFVTNSERKYEQANDAACKLLGYTKEELLQMTTTDVVFEEDTPLARKHVSELNDTGKSRVEFELKRKDGEAVHVILNTVKLPNGKRIGFCEDITERKKAEQALEQSNHSLATLNAVSIELASLPFDTDIREFLAKRLREITGAVAVAFADYDAGNKTLVARLAEFEPGMQEEFTRLLGKSLGEIRCPVSEKDYREITKSVIGKRQKLTEATYGGIPLSVAAEVQKLLGVDRFIGIAYIINGELYGTSLLAIKVGMPDPPPEMLESFGHMAAVSLRRRRAEALALESEERYRELAESISDIFFAFDKGLRCTYWNRASEELMGIKAKDAIGKSLTEVFPDAKGTEIEQVYQNVVKTNKHQVLLTEYQLRGEDLIFELNTYPTRNGLAVFAKDITERKKAEEALHETEERFRAIIETAPFGYYRVGKDGLWQYVNPMWERMHGFSLEEVVGKPFEITQTGEDVEQAKEYVRRALAGETIVGELSRLTHDGDVGYHSFNIQPVKRDNEIVAIEGFINDITERKKAEEALQESEKRYRTLFSAVPLTISITTLNGKAINVNNAIKEMSGYTPDEFLTMNMNDIYVDQSDRKKMVALLQKEGKVRDFETRFKRKDGTIRSMLLNADVIVLNNQTLLLTTVRDITERKRTEEALNGTMKQVTMINEKLGVIGKLTRHDVRNKLSAVVGNTYLAKKMLPNDHKALDYLRNIESACREATRVLDFAATYESLGVEELTLVDVDKAVEEAVSLVSELKGVKVVNNCQGLTVVADSALSQLFFNLIENSLKHGKNVGQIKIYYKEGKDRLKLFYEDNGAGIPKADKPRLFDVGFTTGNGSGLGLPLIKRMMKIYGWTIGEEGEPGKGARFIMTIPKTHITMRARNT